MKLLLRTLHCRPNMMDICMAFSPSIAPAPANPVGTSLYCESDTCAYPAQPCRPLSRDRCTYEYFGIAVSADISIVRMQDSVVVEERNIPPIIHVEYERSELCVCLCFCVVLSFVMLNLSVIFVPSFTHPAALFTPQRAPLLHSLRGPLPFSSSSHY